jgi:hypothetical protein
MSLSVQMKATEHPVYTSDQIHYGEAFVYSPLSDTASIDVREVGFDGNGKKESKTTPGVMKLSACSGLAQILTACMKTNDIFVVMGRDIRVRRGECPQVPLNVILDDTKDPEHLTLIRLCFDVSFITKCSEMIQIYKMFRKCFNLTSVIRLMMRMCG